MKKIIPSMLIVMFLFITISTTYAESQEVTTNQIIEITTKDSYISVKEMLTIQGDSEEIYTVIPFWIQSGANEISILINSNEVEFSSIGNQYISNITALNITQSSALNIELTYQLEKTIEKFDKTVLRNTSLISIDFDKINLFSGNNWVSGNSISLKLYKPPETPLSSYIIIAIVLFIILLVVSTLYIFRRKSVTKVKETAGESKELLTTKKTLLMEVLKDIEKKHRANQISDDTYHKLKDQYKQQAVETMKKLEES